MIAKHLLLAVTCVCCAISNEANAGIWLNGGIASSVGAFNIENVGEPSEFDSFDTLNNSLFFNGVDETSFLLTPGINTFTLTGQSGFLGRGLFFTPTATQLTNANDFGRLPDLNVFVTTGGFAAPMAGTQVATFGQYSGNGAYSGATSFGIGAESVTVSKWDGTIL